jgi:uracil-DNA glycosylase
MVIYLVGIKSFEMENYILQIEKKLKTTKKLLLRDSILYNDIDFSYDFILPFSKADKTSKIKLVIIGQDPTVRREESRGEINVTLNLDKQNSLKTYLNKVCETLEIDLDKEVYATNLFKCFFKFPPADDQTILTRQFKNWMDFLINELTVFENSIFITLGEPLINQLIHSNSKKVNYYWDYIGQTKSGKDFKCSEPFENYLQKRIYPIAHQPTWNRNEFYKKYLSDYLEYIKRNEK